MNDFTLAVGQWAVESDRDANLRKAEAFLREASERGSQLCLLPEMFQTPYELDVLKKRAEPLEGDSLSRVSELARSLSLWVVAGTIAERHEEGCSNTAVVFNSGGEVVGVHRKVHLFDVQLETVQVQESALFTPGESPLVVETPFCRLGVAVCYDARFPAIFEHFSRQGVEVVAIPAAFSKTTGEAHWDLLMRSRAVDYQIYLAAACPAPTAGATYQAHGHSLIVDPWGTVLAQADHADATLVSQCAAERLEKVRRELPLLRHRRYDLYAEW